jgi:tetratricopeptide (TPR) repeat protein
LNREFLQENNDDPEARQETARTYAQLGSIHQLLGEPKEAEKLLRQGLELSEGLVKEFPDQPEYRVDLAHRYQDLGSLLGDTKPQDAEEAYRRGLALLKEVVAHSPGVPDYRDSLASTQNSLGAQLSRANRPLEAEAAYREAIDIWQELATADPDAPKYQSNLGGTYSNLGMILMHRGQRSRSLLGASTVGLMGSTSAQAPLLTACALLPERVEELPRAQHLTTQAIDHQHKALKVFPRNTMYRKYLANHYDLLGAIEKRLGDYGEAERAMRESKNIRERLVDDFPAIPDYRSELGGVLNNLAIIQLLQGKLAEARRSVEDAIAHQQAARKMNPEAPLYRQYLRNHYWNRADILVLQGEHGEAVRAAAELSAVFPDSGGDHFDAAGFLARCMPLAEKDATLPEEKRKELVQTYADQAMQYLRDGAAKGPMDAANIQRRPAFEPLRSRADYKALMAELEAKPKPAPR